MARVATMARRSGERTCALTRCIDVSVSDVLTAGRAADLRIGIDPEDGGISREALRIECTADGWVLTLTNRNGAAIHRWGQPSAQLHRDETTTVRWPRVGIRVRGAAAEVEHWVLLEDDTSHADSSSDPDLGFVGTELVHRPPALTRAQRDALHGVFAEHLAWPPVAGPLAAALETVGRHLGVSYAAIVQRLEGARRRAEQLGAAQRFGVSDPEYLFVLVAHGYVEVPPSIA